MYNFVTAEPNLLFSIAFMIVALLLIIEILGQVVGLSFGQLLDGSADTDISADASASSFFAQIFSWLGMKKLPMLVWLVLFLISFAVAGMAINFASLSVFNSFSPSWLSSCGALIFSGFSCRYLGNGLAKLIPKEETSAITTDSFAGRLAQITVGTAKKGLPAEAVFKDEFQQKHYVMVEPIDDEEFPQGSNVVLVSKEDKNWLVTSFD